MHIRKYLSIFLVGFVFVIAGCSSDSSSGISEEDRLPDTDNDGIVDKHDPDIDGDGILNKDDADDDGDGTPDTTDPTPNGDGGEAPTPGLACTSAIVLPPKEGTTGRLNTASWELLPEGCETTVSRLIVVTASADQASPLSTDGNTATSESQSAYLGKLTTNIILPQDCGWEGTIPITYDFSEIANALGDSSPGYTPTVDASVGDCNPPVVNVSNIRSSKEPYPKLESTVSPAGAVTVSDLAEKGVLYTPASQVNPVSISELSEPKWSATPKGFMNIYTSGRSCPLKRIDIDPSETAGAYYTVPSDGPPFTHYPDWASLQAAEEVENCKVAQAPIQFVLGNFVVNWDGRATPVTFTIFSYRPQTQ